MLATDRLHEERLFHDAQADGRAGRFRDRDSLRFAYAASVLTARPPCCVHGNSGLAD